MSCVKKFYILGRWLCLTIFSKWHLLITWKSKGCEFVYILECSSISASLHSTREHVHTNQIYKAMLNWAQMCFNILASSRLRSPLVPAGLRSHYHSHVVPFLGCGLWTVTPSLWGRGQDGTLIKCQLDTAFYSMNWEENLCNAHLSTTFHGDQVDKPYIQSRFALMTSKRKWALDY